MVAILFSWKSVDRQLPVYFISGIHIYVIDLHSIVLDGIRSQNFWTSTVCFFNSSLPERMAAISQTIIKCIFMKMFE